MKVLFIFIVFHICFQVSSQNSIQSFPPSPEAASIGKFGDIPVSLFTGIPNISVPIVDLSLGSIKLPISIDYHAGGIKVDELSSSVGIGWALNAGGTISLSINGLKDNESNALPDFQNFNPDFFSNPTHYAKAKNVSSGLEDGEPDVYYYNFGGRNGKIVFNGTSVGYPIPYEKIKIERSAGITITDEKGIKYYFNNLEQNAYVKSGNCGGSDIENTWIDNMDVLKLSRIESPEGRWINFTYGSNVYSYNSKSQSDYSLLQSQYGCSALFPSTDCNTTATVSGSTFLDHIDCDDGTLISFLYSNVQRKDLPGTYWLDRITLKNKDVQKNFILTHSYFESGASNSTNSADYRLSLERITEDGKMPYVFSYNYSKTDNIKMSRRGSFLVDYWGYYNGEESNTSLLPTVSNYTIPIPGANREPVEAKMKYLSLSRISYPTGGYSVFDYATNRYAVDGSTNNVIRRSYAAGNGSTNTGSPPVFHIPDGAVNIMLGYSYSTCLGSEAASQYCSIKLVRANDVTKYVYFNSPEPIELLGTPGTLASSVDGNSYYLTFDKDDCNCGAFVTWDMFESEIINVPTHRLAGGLRIERITSYASTDDIKPVVKRYEYLDPATLNSSGFIIFKPKHDYVYSHVSQDPDNSTSYKTCQYVARVGTSITPLGLIKGGSVAYKYVSELYGETGEGGKSVSEFKITGDQGASAVVPFAPVTSYDFQRGQLLNKIDYRFNVSLNTFEPVKKLENTYQFLPAADFWNFKTQQSANEVNVVGIKVFTTRPEIVISRIGAPPLVVPAQFESYPYKFISAWEYLKSQKQEIYQLNSNGTIDISKYVRTINNYTYDNPLHAQVTKIENISSSGLTNTSLITYPLDYASNTTYPFIADYKTKHLVSYPIEKVNYTTDLSGTLIQSGSINTYKLNGLLDVTYLLEKDKPIPLSQYKFSNNSIGVLPNYQNLLNLSMDTRFRPSILYHNFDSKGNLLSNSKIDDIKQSYLYGYNQTYPIAQVVNANYNEIFFDSFEEGSGWDGTLSPSHGDRVISAYDNTRARAGKYSGKIEKLNAGMKYVHYSKELSISLTSPTKFKYSGWVYSNGPGANIYLFMKRTGETFYYSNVDAVSTTVISKWVYLEKEFDVPADIVKLGIRIDNNGGGTVWFDDIRLHRSNARMTTYTYEPLKGMTSQTDINNKSTHYEYDAFGRLLYIRDHNKNILKKYCYNYKGQEENCGIYQNAAINTDYYSENCLAGQTPQHYLVTVPAGMFTSNSQETANQQAREYAQSLANDNGICASPLISISCVNNSPVDCTIELVNESTNLSYILTVSPYSSDILSDIPEGVYNVTISHSQSYWRNYSVCDATLSGYIGATFSNVSIGSSCNDIAIY